jgi:uncharacterized repeat protein (TIGR01451 family)
MATPAAAFSPRDTATTAVFLGKMWLSNGYPEYVRDLWSSVDGVNWERVLDNTPYDLFARLAVYDGKLWAISVDVWSSEDGVNWVQVLPISPFRYWSEVAVHDGKLWVLGNGPEVWSSTDGANWTLVTANAPYGDRNNPAVTEFDGKLWLMGGSTPAPGKGFSDPDGLGYLDLDMHNDVWSSTDGATWTLVTADAPWRPRMWFSAKPYAGRLWIMGGYDNDTYENLGDTWYTTDGVNWRQLIQPDPSWSPRHFPATWIFNGNLWMAAGNAFPFQNDVWALHSTTFTTTTVTPSINPANYGEMITLTGAVTPSAATGTITFRDGSTVLATVPVAAGAASFDTSSLVAGSHPITASYSGDADYDASVGSVTMDVQPIGAAPVIEASFDPSTIPLNGKATLTFTISNPNPSLALTGIAFTDNLPDGLNIATPNGLTGTCGAGTVTATEAAATVALSGGTLAAGSSCTFSVDISGTTAGLKTNDTGIVTAAESGPGNSDSAALEVIGPDLTITKSHTGDFTQGDIGKTYTILVSNAGLTATSTGVTVADALPAGLVATAIAGSGWNCTLSTLTCSRSDALAPSASYPPITLTVNVTTGAPPTITNSAQVSGGGEINTSNDHVDDATTIVQLPDLSITSNHTGNFAQGQTGRSYTITVANPGHAPTAGTVTVVDTLPIGLTATSMTGTGWSCNSGTSTCTRNDALAPGGSYPLITLTVDVSLNAPPVVINSAAVSAGTESDLTNNTSVDSTGVITTPLNLTAVAISTTQVSIIWAPVPAATNYQVFRSSNNGPYSVVGFPVTNGFLDIGVAPNTTFVYYVRATDDSNIGPPSNFDLATTIAFSDDPIVPSVTTIKANHLLELRSAVNLVRAAAGLSQATFARNVTTGVLISGADITEVRAALDEARSHLFLSAIAYADPLLPGDVVKAVDIRELRSGVK